MRLLLDDEVQRGNAINTLLSLLILGERVVLEEAFKPGFGNDADQCDELRIGLVGAGMLKELFDKLAK